MARIQKMTRLGAVQWLFNGWSLYSFALLALLATQVVSGKYGGDWLMFAYWGIANISAPMALLVPAAFSNTKGTWKDAEASLFKFRTAKQWSIAGWSLTAAAFVVEPLVSLSPMEVLGAVGIVLAFVQVRALGAIGAVVFDAR